MTEMATAAAAGAFTLGGKRQVNRMGFGAMRITGNGIWGPPDDKQAALRVLRRAVELGVNLVDTADAYGPDVSEDLIAEALHPYPADLVIATMGGLLRDGPGRWRPDARPAHLREAIEGSLRRLRLEHIDLYQLHSPDDRVPFAESVGALKELQAAGKISLVGLCNVSRTLLNEARELVDVVTVQNRYNLTDRGSERVLEACAEASIGFIPWFPLATGNLARPDSAVAAVAKKLRCTPSQVALAWLLHRSPAMLPIPGTASVPHLEENVAAAGVELTDEDYASLERL